jgi:hypothetical protein
MNGAKREDCTGCLVVLKSVALWHEKGHLSWQNRLFWGGNTWNAAVGKTEKLKGNK